MKKTIIILISIMIISLISLLACKPELDNENNPARKSYETQIVFEDGFETGSFSNDYTGGGESSPLISSTANSGNYSAQLGNVSDSQSSYFELTFDVIEGSTLSFYYKVSSESGYDKFNFYVNDTKELQDSGEVGFTLYTYDLSEGTYTFKWEYKKDYSVSNGSDTAWIDDIMIQSPDTATDPPVSTDNGWEDGFESGDLTAVSWNTSGDMIPAVQSTTKYEGSYALKFGTITHNNTSVLEISNIEATSEASLSFYYKVSSERNYDFFNFYINDTRILHESGEIDFTQYSYDLSEGTYTFKWEYKKDGSVSNGSDTAWIDSVVFTDNGGTPPVTEPEIQVTGSTDFGTVYLNESTTKTYTISNIGDSNLLLTNTPLVAISGADASEFSVSVNPESTILPGENSTFTVAFSPITTGSKSATISIVNNDPANSPFTFVINGTGEENNTNPTTEEFFEDFENGTFSSEFTLSGDVQPIVQTNEKHEGTYGAEFGDITDNNTSKFELANISISEASILTFWYKVSSESGYDFFNFYINGTEELHESGAGSWQKYTQSLATGTYTLTWEYVKDGSVSSNDDTAYIDDIQIISSSNAVPEINVVDISSGSTYDLGSVSNNDYSQPQFTIQNNGTGTLNISNVSISGNSAYSIGSQPASTIAGGESTTFSVAFAPTSTGTKTATINIYSNDDTYTFYLTANVTAGSDKEWLFMVYLDGANNLESAGIDDINEMEYGLYQLSPADRDKMKVVVLFDRMAGYSTADGDWTGTRIYEIEPDSNMYQMNSTLLTGWWGTTDQEQNMGDPNTLVNFIDFCQTRYQGYSKEAVVLWNHGGGTRSSTGNTSSTKAICWDDEQGHDTLYLDEVQQAINSQYNSSNKLEVLGFDACLMGMIEVAYEFRNNVEYMSFSPNTEWGDGWDYTGIMRNLVSGTTAEQLVTLIVQTYKTSTAGQRNETQTAVDLSKMNILKQKMDDLAVAMYNENKQAAFEEIRSLTPNYSQGDYTNYPFYEIGNYCNKILYYTAGQWTLSQNVKQKAQAVLDAVGEAVVYAYAGSGMGNYYGPGDQVKKGLAFFFPKENKYPYNGYWYTSIDTYSAYGDSDKLYGNLDYCTYDNDGVVETWKELLEAWYDAPTASRPNGYYTVDTF